MSKNLILATAMIALAAGVIPEASNAGDCSDGKCPGARRVCFNLYCEFDAREKDSNRFKQCEAAARILKWVGADGSEILDRSSKSNHPSLQVRCDEKVLYNNSSYRFTDEKGTRIQAVPGPYPAVLLPRGTLEDGHGHVLAALELSRQTLKGSCHLYTEPEEAWFRPFDFDLAQDIDAAQDSDLVGVDESLEGHSGWGMAIPLGDRSEEW